jgi:endonuclease YncB( thermonuclease family)
MKNNYRALAAFIAISLLIILDTSAAQAERETVTRVKDCDTFEIAGHKTFGFATSIRVDGIDCPESDLPPAKCPAERDLGLEAKAYAKVLADGSGGLVWRSKKVKQDKYNSRYLARVKVRVNGKRVDWAKHMIEKGYALPYVYVRNADGKRTLTKPDWCAIIAERDAAALIEQTLPTLQQ